MALLYVYPVVHAEHTDSDNLSPDPKVSYHRLANSKSTTILILMQVFGKSYLSPAFPFKTVYGVNTG